MADSDQLLDVLAELSGDHDEVVLSHIAISSFVRVAVIYIFQDLYLLFEVSRQLVDVLSPALNSVFRFAVFDVQTIRKVISLGSSTYSLRCCLILPTTLRVSFITP